MARTSQGDTPRILIIRPTALGDVCRTVPALVTLRQAHPDARIDWLVSETFADAIRHHPAVNELVPFARGRLGAALVSPTVAGEAIRWANQLRHRRYDLVFDLQGLFRSGMFTWLTRATRRVGYANGREFAWLGYNRRHHVDPRLHAVDRVLELLAREGYQPRDDMRLYIGAHDLAWLEQLLSEHGGVGEPYVCVAPTARWRCKCWPIDSFTAIAHRLMDTGIAGKRLVVIASPRERQYVQPLLDSLSSKCRVIFPSTSVGQMMALISRCSLLVCNDSAPLHVAVGFDRPIVTIFGPTDPSLVGPYRRAQAVVQPSGIRPDQMRDYRGRRNDQSLITQVTIDAVWSRIAATLADQTR